MADAVLLCGDKMLKVYAIKTGGCDRHEVGRTLLRWKYEELWGRALPEIVVTEEGKPQFADGPGFFSLSYTDGLCCCALCDGPVGLDVEKIRSVSANAISRILSREEWLQYSASRDPAECFLRFWTLKEAYCKFTGKGIAGTRLRETSFDLSGEHPKLISQENLHLWSRKIDVDGMDIVLSLCADRLHRPEFYQEEL